MSWANELYQVYETQCGREFDDGSVIIPIYHSSTTAKIEVAVNENGEFVNARFLSDEEGRNTIYPSTDASAGRSGKKYVPHPFADQIKYVAGDSPSEEDKANCFEKYINQLEKIKDIHPSEATVYAYLSKRCLFADLTECLKTDKKFRPDSMAKLFVRFRVNYKDLSKENQTWKDKELYECFSQYISSIGEKKQLCYMLGEEKPVTYNHPKKILKNEANAKLISANDTNGFTYKGRFLDANEAISISYEFSQKMHIALLWLMQRQGIDLGSMTIIVWASIMQQQKELKSLMLDSLIKKDSEYDYEDDAFESEQKEDTMKNYSELTRNRIWGIGEKFEPITKILLLGLDSSSKGRASVSLYQESDASEFLNNLTKWHEDIEFIHKGKETSRSIRQIIFHAFGTEIAGKIVFNFKNETQKKFFADTSLRLIPCITQGRLLPADIVNALFRKASNPLSYEKAYNHRMVLETACGMIRKHNIDRKVGITVMAYDPTITDRSYLYGCLLAVADAAERSTYEKDENDRITNARRYWSAFSDRPCKTWSLIEERLRPYLDKLGKKSVRYEKMINEIMEKMGMNSFMDNSSLSPAYLLGYHHYTNKIYLKKEEI